MKKSHKFVIISIILLLSSQFSCTKEAPTVNPGDYVEDPITTTQPGYSYPMVTAIYPANGSTNVPVDSKVTIVFNIPIDVLTLTDANLQVSGSLSGPLSIGVDITLTTGINYAQLTFAAPFDFGEIISITTTSGIRDDQNNISLNNPQTYQFTAGNQSDFTAPSLTGNTPVGAAELVSVNITATFNETLDPATINSSTFYVMDSGGTVVDGFLTYTDPTITFNPTNNLLYDKQYNIYTTSALKDLSGNAYIPGGSPEWFFTTELETDTTSPGAPTFASSNSPSIYDITGATAQIVWTTNEHSSYSLDYGRGTDFTAAAVTSALFTLTHSRTLLTLTAGARYYYNIYMEDEFGNGGTSATFEFNTQTPETPSVIDNGAGHQLLSRYIPQKAGVASSGAFVFWDDSSSGNDYLFGRRYNSSFTDSWTNEAIFTVAGQDYSYFSAAEDEVGGVIVLASNGGSGVYAKRLSSNGTHDWGYAGTDSGLQVDTNTVSVVKASAAVVYSGIFNTLASGTTEMSNLTNAFYNFTDDFITIADTGDIVYEAATGTGTTVTASNFRHALSQTAVVITSGNTYEIFDVSTGTSGPYTADDHTIVASSAPVIGTDYTGAYASGTNNVYTGHGVTGITNAGDLVYDGTNYAIVSSESTIGPITPIDTGTANYDYTPPPNYLVDTTTAWPSVAANDIVYNFTDSTLDQIISIDNIEIPPLSGFFYDSLRLNNDTFDNGNEVYRIYDQYCTDHSGQINQFSAFDEIILDWAINIVDTDTFNVYSTSLATGTAQTPPANPLYDNDPATIFTTLGLAAGDIVFNYTTGTVGQIRTAPFAISDRAFDIDGPANMFSDGDAYRILRFNNGDDYTDIITSGIADSGTVSSMTDAGNTFTGYPVVAGDIIYNVTDNNFSRIVSVAANVLTLTEGSTFGAGDGYIIIRSSTIGVFYAWQEGTSIHWRIYEMNGTPPTAMIGEQTIANAQYPYVVSDGNGNAYLVYRTTGGSLIARLYSLTGSQIWSQNVGAASAIHNVISDNNGGIIVLYQNGGNMIVHRILDNSGAYSTPWNYTIATAPSSTDMVCNSTASTVIVVGEVTDNIYAWSRGGTTWSTAISTDADIQQNPKVYVDSTWTNARIVWEDNRFVIGGGYGIFGQQIAAATGTRAWDADTYDDLNAGTTTDTDMDGVTVILNKLNGYWPNMIVVPYNNNANANIIWDDWRALNGSDIVYRSLSGFTPY
ncbi:MAG: Ig-like domain-containing protein [Spirochaetes bacterium]|nr:Ig-like domain-containing protein [Spirochaetota bacterium]